MIMATKVKKMIKRKHIGVSKTQRKKMLGFCGKKGR